MTDPRFRSNGYMMDEADWLEFDQIEQEARCGENRWCVEMVLVSMNLLLPESSIRKMLE